MSEMVSGDSGLGARLRGATQELHNEVERAGIMPALLRGQLDRYRYCALLRNLHALYGGLEAALARHAAHADVARVSFPSLFRQAALGEDLQVLHANGWTNDFALQPATLRYLARLQTIADDRPELLVAHAYVRYLGDLSGGQLLRRIVSRNFDLDPPAGTRFYDFGSAAEVAAHLRAFRVGLDAIAADEPRTAALVAEARLAFGLHGELFIELATVDLPQVLPTNPRI